MEPKKNSGYNEEIDLTELLVKFGQFIRRWYLRLIVYVSVGAGIGLGWSFFRPAVYTNSLVIHWDALSSPHLVTIVKKFNLLLKEQKLSKAIVQVGLDKEDIKKILNVRLLNSAEDDKFFFIESKVFDPLVWPKLQKAIMGYIENNKYIQGDIAKKRKLQNMEMERIKNRIETLRKTKDMLLAIPDRDRKDFDVDLFPINSELNELEVKRQQILRQFLYLYNLEVVEDFIQHNKPDRVDRMYYVLTGGLIGLFVGIIVLFYSSTKPTTSQIE